VPAPAPPPPSEPQLTSEPQPQSQPQPQGALSRAAPGAKAAKRFNLKLWQIKLLADVTCLVTAINAFRTGSPTLAWVNVATIFIFMLPPY
jgi:hypothetical protein